MPQDLTALVAPDAHRARAPGGAERCRRRAVGAARARGRRRARRPDPALRGARAPRRARSGVPVFHCTAETRDDLTGANRNARLFAGVRKAPVQLSPGSDGGRGARRDRCRRRATSCSRVTTVSGPMTGTQLDPMLRNLGVTTIVGVGVSVNIGMTNFAFDAVNRGYQFVMPTDAVAGVPGRLRRRGRRQHALARGDAHDHRRRARRVERPMIVPDGKDWTWVLDRRCDDCGFDATAFPVTETGARTRANAATWEVLLQRDDAPIRFRPDRWSVLEYACHVRDVFRVYDGRLARMLDEDGPHYDNWDQDDDRGIRRVPRAGPVGGVGPELVDAAETVAARFDTVTAEQWGRTGFRGDGAVVHGRVVRAVLRARSGAPPLGRRRVGVVGTRRRRSTAGRRGA